MKKNILGSIKEENLVYIQSTLQLISQKHPRYNKEGPFNRWDQCINNAICVDYEIQPNGLVEIPPVSMDEEELPLESDSYLESLLIKDLNDADENDLVEVDSLSEMASGSQINYVVHCSMFFEFSISYLEIHLGIFWM